MKPLLRKPDWEAVARELYAVLDEHKFFFEDSGEDTGWDVCIGCGAASWRDHSKECPVAGVLVKYRQAVGE